MLLSLECSWGAQVLEPLHATVQSEAAFAWGGVGERGDAALRGAQGSPEEQKAPQRLREERANFSWVKGKGGSMGK